MSVSALRRAARLGAVAIVAAATSTVLIAAPAQADTLTIATFVNERNVAVPFGTDWLLTVSVYPVTRSEADSIGPNDGTVDVFVDGSSTPFIRELPVNPGGLVFVTQPVTQPLLPAGTHTVVAVFTPTTGGEYRTAQTRSAASVEIAPLAAVASVEIVTDASEVAVPTVRTSFGGPWVDRLGAPPAGEWQVRVLDATDDAVFTQTASQPTQSATAITPLDIPITARLNAGATYRVETTFAPDDSIVGGIEFTDPEPLNLTTEESSLGETLIEPVEVSAPVLVTVFAAPALALALGAALVFALVRRRETLKEAEPITGEIEIVEPEPQPSDITGEIVIEDDTPDRP